MPPAQVWIYCLLTMCEIFNKEKRVDMEFYGLYGTRDSWMEFSEDGYLIRQGNSNACGVVANYNVLRYFDLIKPGYAEFFKLFGAMVSQKMAMPDGSTNSLSQTRSLESFGLWVYIAKLDEFSKWQLERDINNPGLAFIFGVDSEPFWANRKPVGQPREDHVITVFRAGPKTFSGIDPADGRRRWPKEQIYSNSRVAMIVSQESLYGEQRSPPSRG